jgi:hypothetical protein
MSREGKADAGRASFGPGVEFHGDLTAALLLHLCTGGPWGSCGCAGKSDSPSSFAGACPFGEPPHSSFSKRRRAGAGSRFSRKAGLFSSPGAFRTPGRNAPIWPARASCVPCPKFSPGVRCGVPLGLLSHSGRRFNVGPVARAVNPGGAPSAARKGEFRSSSGCRASGAPSRPRAACSVPYKTGQS